MASTSTSISASTLVLLHGHGGDASVAKVWGNAIAPRLWRVVAIEAPPDSDGERSWFDTGPRGVDVESIQRSAALIEAVLADLEGGPVVVAGFSQGAAMALNLSANSQVDAVVALSGFLTGADFGPGGGPEMAPGPPVLMLANSHDEVVPSFLSTDAADTLRSNGRECASQVLSGTHEVNRQGISAARNWLQQRFHQGIKVSLGLPTDRVQIDEFVSGRGIAQIASAYEDLGAQAAFVTDHPAPDDRWLAAGGHQALEPTVALSAAAMGTEALRLHTHIYVLAYRNPFLAAKGLASLDALSEGRLILGVAAGYLKPEFEALGIEFETRGAALDRSIELLKEVWTGESVPVGKRSVTARPSTSQRPHPPIWVGGNSKAAMRRAVTLGDGWCPFPTPGGLDRATRTAPMNSLEDLQLAIDRLGEMAATMPVTEGSKPAMPTICFSPFAEGGNALAEELAALSDMGVEWTALAVDGNSSEEVIDNAGNLMAAADESKSG